MFRPGLEKLRQQSEIRQVRKAEERAKLRKKLGMDEDDEEDGGIDWGFGEDAPPEDDEAEDPARKSKGPSVAASDVHSKDQKLFERITKRREKITNMTLELERIRAKENTQGGLTEGRLPWLVCGNVVELMVVCLSQAKPHKSTATRSESCSWSKRSTTWSRPSTNGVYPRTARCASSC